MLKYYQLKKETLIQFFLMLIFFSGLLLAIKYLFSCPVFLNLNSKEPHQIQTPKSEFLYNRRKPLQIESPRLLLVWKEASFPQSDPF